MAVRAVSEGSDKFNAQVNAQRRDRVGHVALGSAGQSGGNPEVG